MKVKPIFIGNMFPDDVNVKPANPDNGSATLADYWAAQGYKYALTEPRPTADKTAEELTKLGVAGIVVIRPMPNGYSTSQIDRWLNFS